MGYDEIMERQRDRDECAAQANEERESQRADSYRDQFDALVRSRNLDAETGCRFMPKLGDVLTEASTQQDQSIFTSMLQALVHCAAKGQIEAQEAMEKVKQFFVEQAMGDA